MTRYLLVITCLLLTNHFISADTDYYKLLDVEKDADSRTIRKAFKKLAVLKHPDKNTDKPNAHEEFLTINRAYEVLKDPELRKKYDQYGEEGLKDDHPSNQYKSWNFYQQEFGLYDNDDEIVTLSHADFNSMVRDSKDLWFVNFYSPHCSHCHTLAPTWRDLARELEGVIRIGAVNCGDDFFLCSQESIRGYPSLFMYPAKRKYNNDHSLEPLLTFALSFLSASSLDLTKFNFKSNIKSSQRKHLPWLISYCGDGGDCLSRNTCKKLGTVFEDLINIATIDCYNANKEMCEEMGVEHGTYYYEAGKVEKAQGTEVVSLDFKEVTKALLGFLPDIQLLDKIKFDAGMDKLKLDKSVPWLIMFVNSDAHEPELRKLPAMLSNLNVARIDCRNMKLECTRYFIHTYPTFLIFKQGGRFEYHYGRKNTHDVAVFAKECAKNKVTALEPKDFPDVINDQKSWIIDFFAPWCPPCMRLLPEFRKASKSDEVNVEFGTVDCAIHQALCRQQKVRSYPSTIFYNRTAPYHFKGDHHAESVITFIKDVIDPPFVNFDENVFDELIERKKHDDIWLVDFYVPWCKPCQQLSPDWRQLAKMLKDHKLIHVGEVNCEEHPKLCQSQNVRSYPSVRLYPQGPKGQFMTYNGWFMNADSLQSWAFEHLPSKVIDLTPDSFNSDVLKSKDPWVVDFYAPWCGPCRQFSPEFNEIAQDFDGHVKFGKLDCSKYQKPCKESKIRVLPSVRLYAGLEPGKTSQNRFGDEMEADGFSIRHGLSMLLPDDALPQEFEHELPFHDEF